MEYLMRCCEEKDLDSLIALCQKHSEYERTAYNPERKKELLKAALFSDEPNLFCYIIESNEQQVGYFAYTFDFSIWDAHTFLYLDCLYLEPDFRGFGIGEKIMERLKAIAIENNCINFQWQTPIFNERAIKFYNKIGGIAKEKVRFSLDLHGD